MKYGKLSESIYDRTVYKTIQSINKSAALGGDCAFFSGMSALGNATGKDVYVIYRAAMDALHKLACHGCNPLEQSGNFLAHVEIFFPESLREAKLRGMIEYAASGLKELGVAFGLVNTTILPGISEVIVSCTAITDGKSAFINKAKPGQDVVMTKWMAQEGSALIAKTMQRDLETRYPLHIIESASDFIQNISVLPEAATAMKSNVSAMHAIREGGVFGGLWDFAKQSDVGLVIDLKRIPVKQETIEVCEFFDINPYKLLSGGSLLIATDHGMTLVSELERQGIHAAVIGKTTPNNDRVICHEEETRFLEASGEDEYYKVMYPQSSK